MLIGSFRARFQGVFGNESANDPMFDLKLAAVSALMRRATITRVHAEVGTLLAPGARLFDLEVDLSDAAPHDCPPKSIYRLTLREPLWLRALQVKAGDDVEVGALLALFTQDADTPLSEQPVRAVRVATAGVVSEPDWWDEAAVD